MKNIFALFVAVMICFAFPAIHSAQSPSKDVVESNPQKADSLEKQFIAGGRQLTFEGRRAGEGYFSADGQRMVFQSERDPKNPFYQIYLMDFETGDVDKVSPGHGKTTCAWIHPNGKKVLFASTHGDPNARKKQQEELDFRASGKERRYAWDYDQTFELWEYDTEKKDYKKLTETVGYDAEGSYSPDGKLIAFASNRSGFVGEGLTGKDKETFERDPAFMNDIYIMNADGTNVKQLTTTKGYDGGPFFSPDGKRICWRRFSEDGAMAEIMSMNIDGTDQKQLTRLGAMSWAPYYHPSGEYLIFTTNRHGFANFELYLTSADGKSTPVRVTHTKGFDGLPVFTPDGKKLSWTTNRTPKKQSQIFIGNWNHEHARKLLGLDKVIDAETKPATEIALSTAKETDASFQATDMMRHVDYLCRPDLGGRMTGSKGERLATAYVAAYLDNLGVKPAGPKGSWFQEFDFPAGAELGKSNAFALKLDDSWKNFNSKQWRPISFSKTGEVKDAQVVFAGYGIAAPKKDEFEEYDSYVHLDVKGKWVMIFRYMPENISPEMRQHLSFHSSLRYKAMVARDKGAVGLIVVSGPNSNVRNQLIPLQKDSSLSGTSISAVSVTDEVAAQIMKQVGKDLKAVQTKLDSGKLMMGYEVKGVTCSSNIEIKQVRKKGRNVVGRLVLGDKPSEEAIVVGAHIDHLGVGPSSSSLAKEGDRNGIHFGADDNASGVSGMLEIAEYISNLKANGKLAGMKRDIIFAGWSGEEMGLHGSQAYIEQLRYQIAMESHGGLEGDSDSTAEEAEQSEKDKAFMRNLLKNVPVYPRVAACFNMDMIGRFDKKLILQGIASSDIWRSEIERRNAPIGIPIAIQEDTNLPTDASSFYRAGVPILSAFTGSHKDYHTPADTPEKLDYERAAQIAKLMGFIVRGVSRADKTPVYLEAAKQEKAPRAAMRAYLGTVPSYGAEDVTGVLLSDATKGAPAAKAGVKSGDIIVELAGRKIENIYDYTYAIEALKVGQKTKIVVKRGDKKITLDITPSSRD